MDYPIQLSPTRESVADANEKNPIAIAIKRITVR